MMLKGAAKQVVLPLFTKDMEANKPGGTPTRAVELASGEPGVTKGQ